MISKANPSMGVRDLTFLPSPSPLPPLNSDLTYLTPGPDWGMSRVQPEVLEHEEEWIRRKEDDTMKGQKGPHPST